MTADKIREVVGKYKRILKHLHMPIRKFSNYDLFTRDSSRILGHVHYMLYELDNLLNENRMEKSFRWLGFIQGCLFCLGLRSLNGLMDDSWQKDNQNQLLFNFEQEEGEDGE